MVGVIPILGALLMIALIHVMAGLFPVTFIGDAHLALWLVSLLIGLVAYVILQQETTPAVR